MSRTIATILQLRDQFTTPAKKIVNNTRNINRENKKTINSIKKMGATAKRQFKNIAKYSAAAGLALTVAFGKQSVDAAKVQIEAETKLAAVMKNTKGITDAHIESIKKYAGELQAQGVIGDEVALSGVQQLATYQLQADTLKTLMPGMEDLIAQQKGLNATTGDAVTFGNMLGKVMNGQVGALSKAGINFTEAQGKVLKFGTEQERAATLAKVLEANVGGVNKALAQTDDGQITQMTNNFGDMQEAVGMRILPLLASFAKWFNTKIPGIQEQILGVLDSFGVLYNKSEPYLIGLKDTIMDSVAVIKTLVNFTVDNFGTIAPIIMTVFGAMLLYEGILIAQEGYTKAFAMAEGIKNGVLATGATTVNAVTIAQWAWNAAMTANPIGLIIAAITAFIVVGILLWKNFDSIKIKAIELWGNIKGFGLSMLDMASNFLLPLKPLQLLISHFDDIINVGKKAWGIVKGFFGGDKEEETNEKTLIKKENKNKNIKNNRSSLTDLNNETSDNNKLNTKDIKNTNLQNTKNINNSSIQNNSTKESKDIVIHINGDIYGYEDFKEKVAKAINDIANVTGSNVAVV